MTVNLESIQEAAKRIHPYIHQTPVLTSCTLDEMTNAHLFFKCENFQKIGAFKIRGATNAVLLLPEEIARNGVATHSSGNHAQALALAAKIRGIPANIVMPNNSASVKKAAVAGYGAAITFCEPTINAREMMLESIIEKTGATFIHPYDNENIIAGQGTVGLEFISQVANLDFIIVPIGGGGLIAGISTVVKALKPQIKIIGAEPILANDAYLSFQQKTFVPSNHLETTICDGLLTPVGRLTLPIILERVDDIFTASDKTIISAMQIIWERMKVIAEPSAAITLAVLLQHRDYFEGKNIGLVLSGGNVDIKTLASLLF